MFNTARPQKSKQTTNLQTTDKERERKKITNSYKG